MGAGRGTFDAMANRFGPSADPMLEALHADGPHPDHAERLMLFGRLVGSWDIVGRFFDEHGQITRESIGEWHFGWVLEGRSPENNLFRWTFSEFTDERVRWQGYVSKDEGVTWVRDEEIILHRRR